MKNKQTNKQTNKNSYQYNFQENQWPSFASASQEEKGLKECQHISQIFSPKFMLTIGFTSKETKLMK